MYVMKKAALSIVGIVFLIILMGCQAGEKELEWGTSAQTKKLVITPLEANITSEHQSFSIEKNYKLADIVIALENNSDDKVTIDESFYKSFGLSVDRNKILAKMAVEVLKEIKISGTGIYFGEIGKGEIVKTRLFFFTEQAQNYTLLYGNNLTKNAFEISWQIN